MGRMLRNLVCVKEDTAGVDMKRYVSERMGFKLRQIESSRLTIGDSFRIC